MIVKEISKGKNETIIAYNDNAIIFNSLSDVEKEAAVYIIFNILYDELEMIPHFQTRIDTAKQKLISFFADINNVDSINFQTNIDHIINTKFYE
jgi:hypothetical protein